MWLTDGETGVGWAVLGVIIIWAGKATFGSKDEEEE